MRKKGCSVSLQGGTPNELIRVDGKQYLGKKEGMKELSTELL